MTYFDRVGILGNSRNRETDSAGIFGSGSAKNMNRTRLIRIPFDEAIRSGEVETGPKDAGGICPASFNQTDGTRFKPENRLNVFRSPLVASAASSKNSFNISAEPARE